uniref:Timeless C-terminal domain-containing protein n=1 Tax=Timema poppense TaxID=170557 RepID=A0A7R9D8W8_TIMPO|nr:unnamed protein product [Timema poppensis]
MTGISRFESQSGLLRVGFLFSSHANVDAEGDSPEVMQPTTHNQESEEDEEEEEDGQEGMGTAVSEQDFQFIDFAKRLAHSKVVQACAMLLHQFNKNTSYTNHCVVKMLHRIVWDINMPAMLFQASLFRTFQRILHSRNEQFKDSLTNTFIPSRQLELNRWPISELLSPPRRDVHEQFSSSRAKEGQTLLCVKAEELSKLAVFVVRKFTEVAATNKKVFMELLFWKSNKDAYDIEQGYGSYTAQTHSSKQAWGEEEEDELRRLYQEFMSKEDGSSSGVVDWILENIINKDRSKRGIVKKLKDLGYNVSTKPPPKRPPKQWTETEVQELTQLFHTYKESRDPVGDILVNLTIVRPRSQVVSQLLDSGLVHDKKELRKKRSGKSSGERDPDSSPGESDSDSGASGSDSERGTSPPPNTRPMPNQPKARAKSNKRRHAPKKVTLFSAAQVATLLKDVIEAGMKEALEWVQSALAEEADDRDDELAEEGVPMLPLTEGTMSAMEDATFLRLLTALGLAKPFQEQETYWRIPPSLLPQDLRSRAQVITHALEGRFTALQDDATQRDGRRGSESLDSSGDEFSRLKRFVPGSPASDTVSPAGGTSRDRHDVTQRNKTDLSVRPTTSNPNITTNITSVSKHSYSDDAADSSVPKSKRRGLNIPVLFDSDAESDEEGRGDESQRNFDQIASTSKTAKSSSIVSTSKNKMSLKKPTPLDSDSELSEATSVQGLEASEGGPKHSIDLLWDSLLSGKSSFSKMPNSGGAKTPSSAASIKPKRHRIIKTPVLDSDSDEEFPDVSRTFDQNKKDTVAADCSSRTQSRKDVLKSILDSSSDSDSESNRSGGKFGNSLWDESNGEMTRRAAHKRILDSDSEDEIKNTKKLHPIRDDD